MEFDEEKAIAYMREKAGADLSGRYTNDDELFNLIDLVFDYYEANGLLDIDMADDDEDDVDFDDLMAYIGRMLRKDRGAAMTPEDAASFVQAYLEYEETIDE